ncbi:MAG: hypothetical protein WBC44_13740 [Planctomycetaceae bacterium]
MRRALPCVAALAVCISSSVVSAQVRSFPYEAVVETDGVPVHSGPGYYVTNRLKQGERVTVHRHDPGGWCMIAPPAGEFSLIAADAVQATGPNSAEIVVQETTARIGSRVTGEHNIEQVPLVQGDRVQLAEGVTAPAGWIAIVPPRGEFRWVPGKYLVPVREDVRSQQDADPFAIPSSAKRPETIKEDAIVAQSATEDSRPKRPTPLASGTPETVSQAPAADDGMQVLRMLDRELEGLALVEPTQWPLEELAAEYGRLKSTHAVSARQIDVRLAQIERMQMVREHYSGYVQLTSATDERDAALVARYGAMNTANVVHAAKPVPQRPPVTLAAPQAETPSDLAMRQVPAAPPAAPRSIVQNVPNGISQSALPTAPSASTAPPAAASGPLLMAPDTAVRPAAPSRAVPPQATATSTAAPQRFDAVGVIQKTVNPHPAAPQHVLVAPNGEILVYLKTQPGISLEQFVGTTMGVDGDRLRHPELTPPMIVVERLTPVRNAVR